ncbi:MAG: hypothetical protein ABI639_02735 [Thermoanaerobaculia bacterium]
MSAEPLSTPAPGAPRLQGAAKPPNTVIPSATGNPIVPPQRTLFKAAWLAVALGFAIEALILGSAAISGGTLAARPFTADLVQKVSWSFIVCAALAAARAASKNNAGLMGVAGLLAAPAGFAIARGLHKGASQALGLVAAGAPGPSPLVVAGIKGLQYAVLGLVLGWIAKQAWGGLAAHAGAGFASGILFGGPLLALTFQALPALSAATVVVRSVNEIFFPVGCALVLYASDTLGKRLG